MENCEIRIEGMSCQGCVKNITSVLKALPGVERASVSLDASVASITFDPAKVGEAQFVTAIEDAGFDVV